MFLFPIFSNVALSAANRRRSKPQRTTRLLVMPLEDRTAPAVLTVNSIADNLASDASLTLREAVRLVDFGGNANAALGRSLSMGEKTLISGAFGSGDRIQFATTLNRQTIVLGGSEIAITRALILDASANAGLAISANHASRVFNIDDGRISAISVSIYGSANGFALIDGTTAGNGGIILNRENLTIFQTEIRGGSAKFGGGIYNAGSLNVTGFTWFKNDSARPGCGGGAIYNAGALSGTNAFFSFNTATYGGAIDNYGPATTSLTYANFDANSADGIDGGGAVYNSGSFLVYNASFTFNSALAGYGGAFRNAAGSANIGGTYYFKNNSAMEGGAIANDPRATFNAFGAAGGGGYFVANVAADKGGAIFDRGVLTIDGNTLFAQNRGVSGGAIYEASSANASINHALFDGNFAALSGGAVFNAGTLLVYACSIANNQANFEGGGIANAGSLKVLSTTIVANRANADGSHPDNRGYGGAVFTSSATPVVLGKDNIAGNFRGVGATSDDEASDPPGSFVVY